MKTLLILLTLICTQVSALVPTPAGHDPVLWAAAEVIVANEQVAAAQAELLVAEANYKSELTIKQLNGG